MAWRLKMPFCCESNVSSKVGPSNVFEEVVQGRKFYNAEIKCDFAGKKLTEKIAAGDLLVTNAVCDVLRHARKCKKEKGEITCMLSWNCMHLALGLCYPDITDRELVRGILRDLLPYSRGIDAGIFYRDIAAFSSQSSPLQQNEKELLDKSMYFLRMASCFKIDLRENNFGREVYGPTKVIKEDSVYYLDLPVGNPSYSQGTVATKFSSPLMLTCENVKSEAALLLLRYGATAHGSVINFLLAQLSAVAALRKAKLSAIRDEAVQKTKDILTYCLRTVRQLRLRHEDQTIGEIDHDSDVYYVSDKVIEFLPEDVHGSPNQLKQLCRCKIRELLRESDNLPEGIAKLPLLTAPIKQYVDILS